MEIYLVGGAVRDQLLGLPVKERDWVVVGATVEEMLKRGFRQVGKDFPVFLHPQTGEEYALARTERKVGRGYTGFTFNASPHVSLEEDLKRRDITINAMAQTQDGVLIDPYHGKDDLEKKILRHVSSAFVEDPVRILRIARFATRFAFSIAPETLKLMRTMVSSGEADALVAERVWKELERALLETYPENFFSVLADCGALSVLFPAIKLPGAGISALLQAGKISPDSEVRFAALLHACSEAEINILCMRYRVPSHHHELAILVTKQLPSYQNATKLAVPDVLNFLLAVDAFRRESRFEKFLLACEACASYSTTDWLKKCFVAAKSVDTKELLAAGWRGKEIGEKLNQKRIQVIEELLR